MPTYHANRLKGLLPKHPRFFLASTPYHQRLQQDDRLIQTRSFRPVSRTDASLDSRIVSILQLCQQLPVVRHGELDSSVATSH